MNYQDEIAEFLLREGFIEFPSGIAAPYPGTCRAFQTSRSRNISRVACNLNDHVYVNVYAYDLHKSPVTDCVPEGARFSVTFELYAQRSDGENFRLTVYGEKPEPTSEAFDKIIGAMAVAWEAFEGCL